MKKTITVALTILAALLITNIGSAMESPPKQETAQEAVKIDTAAVTIEPVSLYDLDRQIPDNPFIPLGVIFEYAPVLVNLCIPTNTTSLCIDYVKFFANLTTTDYCAREHNQPMAIPGDGNSYTPSIKSDIKCGFKRKVKQNNQEDYEYWVFSGEELVCLEIANAVKTNTPLPYSLNDIYLEMLECGDRYAGGIIKSMVIH